MVIVRNRYLPGEVPGPNIANIDDSQEAINDLNEIRVDDDVDEPDPEGDYEPTTPSGDQNIINDKQNTTMTTTAENETKISGCRVLITGGTTGIGREIALEIANLGGKVFIAGRDEQHLNDTINDSKQTGNENELTGIVADLSTSDGITQLFDEADKQFDGELDILINNAALAYNSVMDGSYADWKEVIDTNLLGYIACTNEAVTRMTKSGRGHIVFIGSMSAGVREQGSSIYVATKSGVEGFAESLRKEINEKGIRVTLIEPGAVDTDMQPQSTEDKRTATEEHQMLKASDIAAAVIYALSQDKRCDVAEIRLRPRLQLI